MTLLGGSVVLAVSGKAVGGWSGGELRGERRRASWRWAGAWSATAGGIEGFAVDVGFSEMAAVMTRGQELMEAGVVCGFQGLYGLVSTPGER